MKKITINLLVWLKDNSLLGALIFIFTYIIFTLFFIPGSILTLCAGYIYSYSTNNIFLGILIGFLVVFIGSNIGATLAFLFSKYLFNDYFK